MSAADGHPKWDLFKEAGIFQLKLLADGLRDAVLIPVSFFAALAGLVTFSHILSYVLKHFRNITLALLMGFIIGSLGVVWPWKKTIYKILEDGTFLLDSSGEKVIENYQRFIPQFTSETMTAVAFILLGILIVLALEWYGAKTRK